MYIILVKHETEGKQYTFDCTDIAELIKAGDIVICKTIRGSTIGTACCNPIWVSTDNISLETLCKACGAYTPLKKVVGVQEPRKLMERLTQDTIVGAGIWDGNEFVLPSDIYEHYPKRHKAIIKAFDKLMAYENTKIEPDEIEKLKVENARLNTKLNEAIEDLSGYCDTCALINTCKNHKPSKGLKWWTNCQDWQWRRLEV